MSLDILRIYYIHIIIHLFIFFKVVLYSKYLFSENDFEIYLEFPPFIFIDNLQHHNSIIFFTTIKNIATHPSLY